MVGIVGKVVVHVVPVLGDIKNKLGNDENKVVRNDSDLGNTAPDHENIVHHPP